MLLAVGGEEEEEEAALAGTVSHTSLWLRVSCQAPIDHEWLFRTQGERLVRR